MFDKLFGRHKDTKPDSKENIVEKPSKIEVVPTSEINATVESNENVDLVMAPTSEASKPDEEKPQQPPPLTYKEMKALKRSRYEDNIMNNPKFKKAYLLQNSKTGQMAEIRAASSFHACNIIGWKPNRARLISEREIKEEPVAETTSSSNKTS